MRIKNFFLVAMALIAFMTITGHLPLPVGGAVLLATGTAWGMLHASMTMNVTRDLVNNIGFAPTFYPQVVTADAAKSVGVDIRGFESACFVGISGAIVAAGLVKLVPQECDTLGGIYTDVAAADLDGAFTDFAANTMQKVGYKGVKDFLALRADYTSGTSVLVGGFIVEGDAHIRKVA